MRSTWSIQVIIASSLLFVCAVPGPSAVFAVQLNQGETELKQQSQRLRNQNNERK